MLRLVEGTLDFLQIDLTFARPWVLHSLWAIPGLAILLGQFRKKRRANLHRFVSARLIHRLTPNVSPERRRFKAFLMAMAWLFLLLAWAGPQWGTHVRLLKRAGIDIVVAIDVSESMLAKDVPTTSPNRKQRRLALARRKVRYLMERLGGDRIGIVAFSGQAHTLCPLTIDYNTCGVWLDSFTPDLLPSGGTALASTIRKSIKMFSTSGHNSRALILITDGDDHEKDTLKAAKEAKKKGIHVYTLGIGSTKMVTIDPSDLPPPPKGEEQDPRPIKTKLNAGLLKKIASNTHAVYRHAEVSHRDIRTIFEHAKQKLQARTHSSKRKIFREERFPIFAALGFFFLLLEFGFGQRRKVK